MSDEHKNYLFDLGFLIKALLAFTAQAFKCGWKVKPRTVHSR
ncbi:MAG: hypothetical protein AABZ30_11065 [Myxococcota bacterium]